MGTKWKMGLTEESVEVERLVRSPLSWPNSVLFNLLLKQSNKTPREVSTPPLLALLPILDNRGNALPLHSAIGQENGAEHYLLSSVLALCICTLYKGIMTLLFKYQF